MSAKDALDRYYKKQAKSAERAMKNPRKKNARPEWELTKKPCKKWFEQKGWRMHIVESKAVFSQDSQRYVTGQLEAGFSDSVGAAPNGLAAFVEFKAPGKRSTLAEHQRDFLIDKIEIGCFGVCVDSVECLEAAWILFCQRRKAGGVKAGIQFLMEHLPKKSVPRQSSQPESELPF